MRRRGLRVKYRYQHGQWYATAKDFGMAGVGSTRSLALRDVTGLVGAYLTSVASR